MILMIRFLFFALGFFFISDLPAWSQEAMDYFHGGANAYINGKNQVAKAILNEGLEHFPNDPAITDLLAKIKEEEQKQSQQQDQHQEDGQNQEQQDEQQQQQEKQQQQQANQEQDPGNEEQDKQQERQAEQKQQESEKKEGQQPQGETKEISREDAERILNALKNEEQDLLKDQKKGKAVPARGGKDW